MHCKIEQELHNLVKSKVPVAELIYSDEKHEPCAYAIFRFIPGLHIDKVSSEFPPIKGKRKHLHPKDCDGTIFIESQLSLKKV
jgi:hypothetical protein